MPYSIKDTGKGAKPVKIIKKDTGKVVVVGSSTTKAKAQASIRARYANAKKKPEPVSGIDFLSPTYRSAGTDLVLNISPLGLVELADEEFEVHGPRLNRYALNWALYLGHHWSHRREVG